MSLNKSTIIRLAKDVKYLLKNPLDSENIFYKHDENNILKGYCLIIGHKNTPYEFGLYFFQLDFPENYPFSPPIVSYLTKEPDYEKIKGLIYSKSALQTEEIKKGTETIDSLKLLIDQRISKAFDKVLTVLLIIFVFVIWYVFR